MEKFTEAFLLDGFGLESMISTALTVLLLVGSAWVIYRSHLSPLQGNKGRAGFACLGGKQAARSTEPPLDSKWKVWPMFPTILLRDLMIVMTAITILVHQVLVYSVWSLQHFSRI